MKQGPFAGNDKTGIWYRYDNGTTFGPLFTGSFRNETGTKTSVKTPGFKNFKFRWQLPINPFSQTYSGIFYKQGRWTQVGVNAGAYGYVKGWVSETTVNDYLQPPIAEADAIAKSKLFKRIQGATMNTAQAYAERRQTVNLIAKTTNRLASAAIAIRRGNLKRAVDLFKNVEHSKATAFKDIAPSKDNLANHWLEFSYGWRPLLSDIDSACELLADRIRQHKTTEVFAQHQVFTEKHDYVKSLQGSSTGTNTLNHELMSSSALAKVRYHIEYCEDNAFCAMMSKTGISNPLLLAWELAPYSFVVDWFVPVGQYLTNLQAANGLFLTRGTKSVVTKATHSSKWVTRKVGTSGYVASGMGEESLFETKNRTILTSFPSPSLPTFRCPSEMGQFLSGLSLLTQAFKR